MSKPKLKAFFKTVAKGIAKKSPVILLAAGLITGAAAIVCTVRETAAAKEDLDEKTQRKRAETCDPEAVLTAKEIISTVWKRYISVGALSLAAVLFILCSTGISHRRCESLSAAYGLLAASHGEYVDKVVETVGKTKEKDIRDEIAKDHIRRVESVTPVEKILDTGAGDTLFVDTMCGREFHSSYDAIRRSINTVNDRMIRFDEVITVNDIYDEWKLPHTNAGGLLGWGYVAEGLVSIEFVPVMASDGETPAVGIRFNNLPSALYRC